ncbi:MAG: TetR/AcrR family transcriptional regulator [Anaerolineae bacterium]|nr:TetR/AcrR family transcriptional regulator [Anaerolineae bacterium]
MDNSSKKIGRKLDPRVIRTRKLLRDAIMTLIPEKGFDAITIQDITHRATLNHATFYLHYRDKDDLLMKIIGSVLEEINSIPAPAHLTPDEDTIHAIFVALFDHVAHHAPFYRVMLLEPSVSPYTQKIMVHIEQIGMNWLSMGERNQDMQTPPELFISFMSAAYLGFIKWWVINDMPYSSDYMASQFMRLTISGIFSEFGIRPASKRKTANSRRSAEVSVKDTTSL